MRDPGILHDYFNFLVICAGNELLKEVFVQKFGPVPEDIAAELRHCHDLDLLRDWTLAANAAESLDGFRHYIFHPAPIIID